MVTSNLTSYKEGDCHWQFFQLEKNQLENLLAFRNRFIVHR